MNLLQFIFLYIFALELHSLISTHLYYFFLYYFCIYENLITLPLFDIFLYQYIFPPCVCTFLVWVSPPFFSLHRHKGHIRFWCLINVPCPLCAILLPLPPQRFSSLHCTGVHIHGWTYPHPSLFSPLSLPSNSTHYRAEDFPLWLPAITHLLHHRGCRPH